MKMITRDTDYAIRALVYMANDPDRLTTVQELVDALKMPGPFSRRILQKLSRHGILRSVKGKGGGFTLQASLKRVRLSQLMEVFQGPLNTVSCMFKKRICPNTRTCPLRGRMKCLERKIMNELESITIASLIKGGRR